MQHLSEWGTTTQESNRVSRLYSESPWKTMYEFSALSVENLAMDLGIRLHQTPKQRIHWPLKTIVSQLHVAILRQSI